MSRDDDFLSRWSRRKHAVRRGEAPPEPAKAPPVPPPPAANEASVPAPQAEEEQPLPPVESLTPESDFSPFMRKDIDPVLRRTALKTLFRDPRFNVMDGLDVYIDDYSKPDPIPAEWLGKLKQLARLGDPALREQEEAAREKRAQGDDGADAEESEEKQDVKDPPAAAAPGAPDTESPPPELKR